MKLLRFLKDWTLPTSMTCGVLLYLVLANFQPVAPYKSLLERGLAVVQPTLLFMMLMLTFCRVKPSDMQFRVWHLWLLGFQLLFFSALIGVLCMLHGNMLLEGAALCMICPTATAAAVITRRLGGNAGTLTAYTVLINFCASLSIPAVIPLIHPNASLTFVENCLRISYKVFPVLILPLLVSVVLRRLSPKLTEALASMRDVPFYLWAVSLMLAISVTTKSIAHASCSNGTLLGFAGVSLLACVLQFAFGRRVGTHYSEPVSAAQACGQKNTVLIMWIAYTFMSPETTLAGGFYSIWHNVWNSIQLYRQSRLQKCDAS